MTTKREYEQRAFTKNILRNLGFTSDECDSLRRISMTLHSWRERECGTDNGCIERDETTGKAYWLNSHSMKRYPIRDLEKGAMKRLDAIMRARNGRPAIIDGVVTCLPSAVSPYIQTDPRGAALYILRPGDVPDGELPEAYYSRGICVY